MTVYEPEFLDALERVKTFDWEGVVWRHMFNDYPPELANVNGARWNPKGVAAIYTALDRSTAIAEGQNAIDSQPARFYAKRMLYEIDASVPNLIDLTGEGVLEQLGLAEEDLTSSDFQACQLVGGAVAWLGRGGLLVPSARSKGDNLVILVGSNGDFELRTISSETYEGG